MRVANTRASSLGRLPGRHQAVRPSVPDITEDPLQLVLSRMITPAINTEGEQILLNSGLLLIFGTLVENGLDT
jgi:hypothetical protein